MTIHLAGDEALKDAVFSFKTKLVKFVIVEKHFRVEIILEDQVIFKDEIILKVKISFFLPTNSLKVDTFL